MVSKKMTELQPWECLMKRIVWKQLGDICDKKILDFGSGIGVDVYKRQIQEYGKIKALGATKKQMKQLIFREGIFLTFFSIPVGLLFGFLIAKCGFNWLVEQGNLVSTQTGSMGVQNQQVPLFSLPVMLLCIFVSFLTVALALRKPMKIVSRISPIEATRYLEKAETQKKENEMAEKMSPCFLWQWQM